MTRRVLVTGVEGQLGDAVRRAFVGWDVIGCSRRTLDIADPDAVRRHVDRVGPDAIVNCAAYNDVDGAESAPLDAFTVNAFAVRSLARAADRVGAAFVHYGTDFVFDGRATTPYREDAAPSPRSTYGASKLTGEWFALEAARGFVLRVESLFGTPPGWRGRRGTLEKIVDALASGREAVVFTDRIVSPSCIDDIARATRYLVDEGRAPGLYHCANSGHASWYEVAEEAARLLQVEARLRPLSVKDVTLIAARPQYCALDNAKLAAAGFSMPRWESALASWLSARSRN
jgi:dTDP-4-dehydrorhamnose reductase